MKIALSGLGKMGKQIAQKLHENGHTVIVHNRSKESIEEFQKLGCLPAFTKEEVSKYFLDETIILWLMIPSEVVDSELDSWLKILPQKSIIIDGGNSDFRLTQKRAKIVEAHGSFFFDVGTSGGVWGYQNGFSMMAGGNTELFPTIEPILQTLALPHGAYHFFGESGSGHFVKMTHNAIEYGMMQSLAEGYHLLKNGPFQNLDLGEAGEVWQHHSVITSWLNELCRDILKENPELQGISGFVAESGEARWALEVAKEYNIETPSISGSFQVRLDSQKGKTNFATKLLAAMRNAFGGHKINK
jgi:6-phosphogluconate dehydrogenase